MIALLAALALAEEYRVGLFVGNDRGAAGQQELLFASSDARKMRDLFVDFGGIEEADALLVLGRGRGEVSDALDTLRQRLAKAEQQGMQTVLVFYYSGHGDDQALQLGTSALEHDLLRAWLEGSGADVRVALLDACQSGAVIRQKGGVRGPSYTFAVKADETRGTAVLTSSARSEFSQESQELAGGLFTYYLHGALLGGADADKDGEVTLTEAYAHVHAGTSFHAREAPEHQTPSFDFDLSGSGELVLTRLEQASAWIAFAGGLEGAYSVWDETRKRYVAEVDGARPTRVAVRPGTYFVHHRMPGWVDEAVYRVDRDDVVTVSEVDFLSLAYEETSSRGDIDRQIRKAKAPDLSARLVLGRRGFGAKSVFDRLYLPAHAVAGVDLRWLPKQRPMFFGVDALAGGGAGTLVFPVTGERDVFVQSWSLGGSIGAATPAAVVRAGAGLKAEIIGFTRSFPDIEGEAPVDRQGSLALAPGLTTWAGAHHGRFTADLGFNLLVMPVRWDGIATNPAYGELLFELGARF